jgi:hypothetical protein
MNGYQPGYRYNANGGGSYTKDEDTKPLVSDKWVDEYILGGHGAVARDLAIDLKAARAALTARETEGEPK